MSTDSLSEISQFRQFVDTRSEQGNPLGSLDEAVLEFREYQRQLTDLKEKLRVAEEQCKRGEVGPFDAEATKQWLRDELAKEGIAE